MNSASTEREKFLEADRSRPTDATTCSSHLNSDRSLGPRWMFWKRRRDVLCVLSFFGFFNVSFLRSNLSLAVVAMTSDHSVLLVNGTVVQERDFNWDSLSKGVVLSAFFYGYIVSQVPGGWLAIRLGGHRTYGFGVTATALLTLLTPVAAGVHLYLLVAFRICEGLCEGMAFPSMEFLIARWIPVVERNRFGSLAFSGMPVGSIVSMALSGYIAVHLGWRSVFYVSGSLATVWAICWWLLASDDPLTDSKITAEELLYIKAARAHIFKTKMARITVPWLRILWSIPIWSAALAVFIAAWSFHTLTTQMPTFVKEIMDVDLKNAGLVSAIPHVVAAIGCPLHGYIVDMVQARKLLSITAVRKLSICSSLAMNSVALLCLGHITSASVTVFCLTVSVLLNAICSTSVNVNFLDLAPQYSSLTIGIAHTLSSLAGTISPALAGYIARNKTVAEWQTVFSAAGGVSALGVLVYGGLGSGELQPWAEATAEDGDGDNGPRREGRCSPVL